MNKHQKSPRFAFAAVLLLVMAAVGFAGWTLWQDRSNKQEPPATAAAQNKTQAPLAKPAMLQPYTVPAGWKGLVCAEETVLLLVPGQTDKQCGDRISDPANPNSPDSAGIEVVLRDINTFDTQSCANTITKRENSNSDYPANEYQCTDVTIDGVKGLREVGTHTTESYWAYGVPSVKVTYVFPAGDGKVLQAYYIHYSDSAHPDLQNEFDQFVRSLTFSQSR